MYFIYYIFNIFLWYLVYLCAILVIQTRALQFVQEWNLQVLSGGTVEFRITDDKRWSTGYLADQPWILCRCDHGMGLVWLLPLYIYPFMQFLSVSLSKSYKSTRSCFAQHLLVLMCFDIIIWRPVGDSTEGYFQVAQVVAKERTFQAIQSIPTADYQAS